MAEKNTAIVLAAGQGKRMHSKIQKQFLEIQGHPNSGKEYLTSAEVCEMLHISSRTLQRMRDAKVIGFTFVGNACRFRRSDIEKYLKERGTT